MLSRKDGGFSHIVLTPGAFRTLLLEKNKDTRISDTVSGTRQERRVAQKVTKTERQVIPTSEESWNPRKPRPKKLPLQRLTIRHTPTAPSSD